MKSAYVTLGIPGNAGTEEIQEAYQRALGHFTREKLAANPALHDRVEEVKEAFKVLANADLRQAHDRKINSSVAPPRARVVVAAQETSSSFTKYLVFGVLALVGGGMYVSHQHEEARLAKIALEAREQAQKKEEEAKAEQAEKDAAASAAAKLAAANALAKRDEQQLRNESSQIAQRAQSMELMQQNQRTQRENQEKYAAANEKQQAAVAAAQRAAIDQRALRNLCIINTGRPNC